MKPILLLCVFIPFIGISQLSYNDSLNQIHAFTRKLYDECMKERPGKDPKLYAISQLKAEIMSDSTSYKVKRNANYQLMGYYEYYWEEVVGQNPTTTYSGNIICDSLLNARNPSIDSVFALSQTTAIPLHQFQPFGSGQLNYQLMTYDDMATFKGSEIAEQLFLESIDQSTSIANKSHLPFIFERDDALNRVWTVFRSKDYLMLRKVHSYPYGNMTSFYSEAMFFFRVLND